MKISLIFQIISFIILTSVLSEPATESKTEAPKEKKEEIKTEKPATAQNPQNNQNDKFKIPKNPKGPRPLNLNATNVKGKNFHKPEHIRMIDPTDIANLTDNEKDKYLACSVLLTKEVDDQREKINKTAIELGTSFENLHQKLAFGLMVGCYKKIDLKTARKYFKNLIFLGVTDNKELVNEDLVKIDFSKITKDFNLTLTDEELYTAHKFAKIKNQYEYRRRDASHGKKDSLFIFGYDIAEFGNTLKLLVFFISLAIITFGIIIVLKKLEGTKKANTKKMKDKRKKK